MQFYLKAIILDIIDYSFLINLDYFKEKVNISKIILLIKHFKKSYHDYEFPYIYYLPNILNIIIEIYYYNFNLYKFYSVKNLHVHLNHNMKILDFKKFQNLAY